MQSTAQRTWSWVWPLVVILCLYTGSYVCLTTQGEYVPGAWGAGHVKHYEWAPLYFCRGHVWNRTLMYAYSPLYAADRNYWHEREW